MMIDTTPPPEAITARPNRNLVLPGTQLHCPLCTRGCVVALPRTMIRQKNAR